MPRLSHFSTPSLHIPGKIQSTCAFICIVFSHSNNFFPLLLSHCLNSSLSLSLSLFDVFRGQLYAYLCRIDSLSLSSYHTLIIFVFLIHFSYTFLLSFSVSLSHFLSVDVFISLSLPFATDSLSLFLALSISIFFYISL